MQLYHAVFRHVRMHVYINISAYVPRQVVYLSFVYVVMYPRLFVISGLQT